MKKTFLASFLACAAIAGAGSQCFLSAQPVFAAEETDSDRVYTLDEVKEIYDAYDAIRNEACADAAPNCRMTFLNKFIRENPEYAVLRHYISGTFMITSIDPAANTLRAVHRSRDLSNYERTGTEQNVRAIEGLYMAWFSPGYNYLGYYKKILDGVEEDGLHAFVKVSADTSDGAWFPLDREVEFSAPSANLMDDESHTIYYTVGYDSGNFSNSADYSGCFENGYEPGMECQLRFSSSGAPTYVPVTVVVSNEAPDAGNASDAMNEPSETNDTTNNTDDVNDTNGTFATTATETVSSTPVVPASTANENPNSTTATTPNTGEATAEETGSLEFPWWLGAIFLIGITVLAWFFRPNHQKISKKS